MKVISAPLKKAIAATITWTDAKVLAILEQCYLSKPYSAKKVIAGYETVAAILNTRSGEFKTVSVSGANVKARLDKAVASYVGTYLSESANKSGLDGDIEDEENYSNIMMMAKKIHGELDKLNQTPYHLLFWSWVFRDAACCSLQWVKCSKCCALE